MRAVHGLEALRALEPAWWHLWHADRHATPFQSPAWLLPWAEVFQPGSCLAVVGSVDVGNRKLGASYGIRGALSGREIGRTAPPRPLPHRGRDRERGCLVSGKGACGQAPAVPIWPPLSLSLSPWERGRNGEVRPNSTQHPGQSAASDETWNEGRGAESGNITFLLPLFTLDGGRHILPLGAGTTDWLGPLSTHPAETPIPWPDTAVLIDLPGLPPTTPSLPPPLGWREEGGEGEPCPALDLPATFPRSHRQNLRTARNRLDRLGRVAIRQVSGPGITPALDDLFALHAARWKQDGEAGVLADPLVQAFHRQAAPLLDAAGLLRLYALDLDGRTVAVLYGLGARGRFHYYIGGHDPALAACSPGSLLLAHAIDRATAEGCTLFDFLRGQEPYKYRWGATDRPSHWLRYTRDLP